MNFYFPTYQEMLDLYGSDTSITIRQITVERISIYPDGGGLFDKTTLKIEHLPKFYRYHIVAAIDLDKRIFVVSQLFLGIVNIPTIRRIIPNTIAKEIVGVQPMQIPTLTNTFRQTYDDNINK